ncbi:MAG: type II toxin-antitoxin system VapC family toxin [Gemmatales bacterium]
MILDSSALIAFLKREKGGDLVAEHLPVAFISSVNLAEVLHVLIRGGATSEQAHAVVQHLMLSVEPFTSEQAYLTTSMSHLEGKLSLGDRACLALGLHLKQPVLTAEKSWPSLKLGAEVMVIR